MMPASAVFFRRCLVLVQVALVSSSVISSTPPSRYPEPLVAGKPEQATDPRLLRREGMLTQVARHDKPSQPKQMTLMERKQMTPKNAPKNAPTPTTVSEKTAPQNRGVLPPKIPATSCEFKPTDATSCETCTGVLQDGKCLFCDASGKTLTALSIPAMESAAVWCGAPVSSPAVQSCAPVFKSKGCHAEGGDCKKVFSTADGGICMECDVDGTPLTIDDVNDLSENDKQQWCPQQSTTPIKAEDKCVCSTAGLNASKDCFCGDSPDKDSCTTRGGFCDWVDKDYCTPHEDSGCQWTLEHSCPEQVAGSAEVAEIGKYGITAAAYACCCTRGLYKTVNECQKAPDAVCVAGVQKCMFEVKAGRTCGNLPIHPTDSFQMVHKAIYDGKYKGESEQNVLCSRPACPTNYKPPGECATQQVAIADGAEPQQYILGGYDDSFNFAEITLVKQLEQKHGSTYWKYATPWTGSLRDGMTFEILRSDARHPWKVVLVKNEEEYVLYSSVGTGTGAIPEQGQWEWSKGEIQVAAGGLVSKMKHTCLRAVLNAPATPGSQGFVGNDGSGAGNQVGDVETHTEFGSGRHDDPDAENKWQEVQNQADSGACDAYMKSTGCAWTKLFNCPAQNTMKVQCPAQVTAEVKEQAASDSSLAYTCCCGECRWQSLTTTTAAGQIGAGTAKGEGKGSGSAKTAQKTAPGPAKKAPVLPGMITLGVGCCKKEMGVTTHVLHGVQGAAFCASRCKNIQDCHAIDWNVDKKLCTYFTATVKLGQCLDVDEHVCYNTWSEAKHKEGGSLPKLPGFQSVGKTCCHTNVGQKQLVRGVNGLINCAHACSNIKGCKGFEFDFNVKGCHYYNHAVTKGDQGSCPHPLHKVACYANNTGLHGFTKLGHGCCRKSDGKLPRGQNVVRELRKVNNAGACAEECKVTEGCKYFDWDTKTSECWAYQPVEGIKLVAWQGARDPDRSACHKDQGQRVSCYGPVSAGARSKGRQPDIDLTRSHFASKPEGSGKGGGKSMEAKALNDEAAKKQAVQDVKEFDAELTKISEEVGEGEPEVKQSFGSSMSLGAASAQEEDKAVNKVEYFAILGVVSLLAIAALKLMDYRMEKVDKHVEAPEDSTAPKVEKSDKTNKKVKIVDDSDAVKKEPEGLVCTVGARTFDFEVSEKVRAKLELYDAADPDYNEAAKEELTAVVQEEIDDENNSRKDQTNYKQLADDCGLVVEIR